MVDVNQHQESVPDAFRSLTHHSTDSAPCQGQSPLETWQLSEMSLLALTGAWILQLPLPIHP